jgi:hypothetical protein
MISAEYSCHDILSFTESWLNENTSTDQQCLEIPDYIFPPFRRDRSNKVGGGVIVYVKNTVNCTIRPDLHVGSLECIWLEIKLNNKKNTCTAHSISHQLICRFSYKLMQTKLGH